MSEIFPSFRNQNEISSAKQSIIDGFSARHLCRRHLDNEKVPEFIMQSRFPYFIAGTVKRAEMPFKMSFSFLRAFEIVIDYDEGLLALLSLVSMNLSVKTAIAGNENRNSRIGIN